jgi:hypothetical protein
MYAQAIDASDYEYQTLRKAKYVASRIELFRRRNNLSWTDHAEVAALEAPLADRILELAEEGKFSRAQIRDAVRVATAKTIAAPTEREPNDGDGYSERDQELDNAREALAAIAAENAELRDQLAKGACPEGMDAESLLKELRADVAGLRADLALVTKARDTLLNEKAAMQRQLAAQKKQITKLEKLTKIAA